MPECEFSAECHLHSDEDPCAPIRMNRIGDCREYRDLMKYKPDCENPYRHFPQKSLPPEPVWKEGCAFGQQNPDPKQYANRKELVEEIREISHNNLAIFPEEVIEIIQRVKQ